MAARQRFWRILDRVFSFLPGPPDGRPKPTVTPDPFESGISDAERLARQRVWRARYGKPGKGTPG